MEAPKSIVAKVCMKLKLRWSFLTLYYDLLFPSEMVSQIKKQTNKKKNCRVKFCLELIG